MASLRIISNRRRLSYKFVCALYLFSENFHRFKSFICLVIYLNDNREIKNERCLFVIADCSAIVLRSLLLHWWSRKSQSGRGHNYNRRFFLENVYEVLLILKLHNYLYPTALVFYPYVDLDLPKLVFGPYFVKYWS